MALPHDAPETGKTDATTLPRFPGQHAEEAALRARVIALREAGDEAGEAKTAGELAKKLLAEGAELGFAAELLERSLSLQDDPALRAELASLLTGLGEPSKAAEALRFLVPFDAPKQAARLLAQMGLLRARGDDFEGALEAFDEAHRLDPDDPTNFELAGMLASIAPLPHAAEKAARFFVQAARCHERAGDEDGLLENLFRAFDIAPSSEEAVGALSTALDALDREDAVREVERLGHEALPEGPRRRTAHLERMRAAMAEGDFPLALACALDAGIEGVLEGAEAERFDDLLSRLGLGELLSARLEMRADWAEPAEKGRALADLARLCTGPLASPERAIQAWLAALSVDPSHEEALRALRAHATATRDHATLVEALLRAGANESAPKEARMSCWRELAKLAEGLEKPSLRLYALRHLDPGEAETTAPRLAAQLHAEDEAIAALRSELASLEGTSRIGPLRRLSELLAYRPEDAEALGEVLIELVTLAPGDAASLFALERLIGRGGHFELLEANHRGATEGSPAEARARLFLMRAARRRNDLRAALAEILPLVEQRTSAPAACHALLLAAKMGETAPRATALSALAGFVGEEARATLLSAAAEAHLAAGELPQARAAAATAVELAPRSIRATMLLARLDARARDPRAAWTIPQALEIGLPRSDYYRALVEVALNAGETAMALVYARRWLSLRPADATALEECCRLATKAGHGDLLEECVAQILERPLPSKAAAPLLATALLGLRELAPSAAPTLARRALDSLGPAQGLTEALAAVAEDDPELRLTLLERKLAKGTEPPGPVLLELAEQRRALGQPARALRAYGRFIEQGADVELALSSLPKPSEGEAPDVILARLEARTAGLLSLGEARIEETSASLRDLAAARWDLAGDRDGAMRALVQSARLAEDLEEMTGSAQLARDLSSLDGAAFALSSLEAISKTTEDLTEAALALTAAARIANDHDDDRRALVFAEDALSIDPRRYDALSVLEKAARSTEQFELLDEAYVRLAEAAFDDAERHAAHLRAARELAARGLGELAFSHASKAFATKSDAATLTLVVEFATSIGASVRAKSAIEAQLPRLSGTDGATTAAIAARAALERLQDTTLAHAAIRRAIDLDPENEEIGKLTSHAVLLAKDAELALSWIDGVIESASEPRAQATAALRLASTVAERLDDPSAFARLLVEVARPSLLPNAPEIQLAPISMPAAAPSSEEVPVASETVPKAPPAPTLEPEPAFNIPELIPSLAPAAPTQATAESEADLLAALQQGSLEAGDRLADRLMQNPARTRDLVYVRYLQAGMLPGDRSRLEQLRAATVADRDLTYARSVEHVLRIADGSGSRLPPPALGAQVEQPEAVSRLLFRSPPHLGLEALAVICEGAPQLFRRDLTAYGSSGAERVPLGSRTPIGRVYTLAARLIGLTRVPLFHVRSARKPSWIVALLSPPAILLTGEAQEDTAELRYEIGAALASAMPAHALIAALPRERAQTVLSAVLAAYGPPSNMPRYPAVAAIAETLWQLLPARAERYMRDLCARVGAQAFDYEPVVEHQKLLVRRAGLFVSGDLELAVYRYFAEERLSPPVAIDSAGGLAAICAAHPTVADLVRLAISPDYAKARWHVPSGPSQVAGVSSPTSRSGT